MQVAQENGETETLENIPHPIRVLKQGNHGKCAFIRRLRDERGGDRTPDRLELLATIGEKMLAKEIMDANPTERVARKRDAIGKKTLDLRVRMRDARDAKCGDRSIA